MLCLLSTLCFFNERTCIAVHCNKKKKMYGALQLCRLVHSARGKLCTACRARGATRQPGVCEESAR